MSSQVRGRPVATGSSSWSLPTAACGSTASVTMISLYRLCRTLGTKPRPLPVQPALRQLLGKGGQVFAGCFINFEVHELGGLGDEVGILCRKSRRPRFVVLVVAEHDERGGWSGLLGSGCGLGGRLGHDRSPETPKGPDGPLCGETDRFWQQSSSLAGGYLGLMTVCSPYIQSLRGRSPLITNVKELLIYVKRNNTSFIIVIL